METSSINRDIVNKPNSAVDIEAKNSLDKAELTEDSQLVCAEFAAMLAQLLGIAGMGNSIDQNGFLMKAALPADMKNKKPVEQKEESLECEEEQVKAEIQAENPETESFSEDTDIVLESKENNYEIKINPAVEQNQVAVEQSQGTAIPAAENLTMACVVQQQVVEQTEVAIQSEQKLAQQVPVIEKLPVYEKQEQINVLQQTVSEKMVEELKETTPMQEIPQKSQQNLNKQVEPRSAAPITQTVISESVSVPEYSTVLSEQVLPQVVDKPNQQMNSVNSEKGLVSNSEVTEQVTTSEIAESINLPLLASVTAVDSPAKDIKLLQSAIQEAPKAKTDNSILPQFLFEANSAQVTVSSLGQSQNSSSNSFGSPLNIERQHVQNKDTKNTSQGQLVKQDKIIEKIQEIINQSAQTRSNNSVVLNIDPPDLGKITVKVTQRDGQIYARVTPESAEVEYSLRTRVTELMHALALNGLRAEQIHVSIGAERLEAETFQFSDLLGRQSKEEGNNKHSWQASERMIADNGGQEASFYSIEDCGWVA